MRYRVVVDNRPANSYQVVAEAVRNQLPITLLDANQRPVHPQQLSESHPHIFGCHNGDTGRLLVEHHGKDTKVSVSPAFLTGNSVNKPCL